MSLNQWLIKLMMASAALAALTGCSTMTATDENAFADCQIAAMTQHEKAAAGRTTALYHVAATHLARCVNEAPAQSDVSAMVHTQALAVVNFFKAGAVIEARTALDSLRHQFAGKDLYFDDGASFIDSMSLLLGEHPAGAANTGSLVNARSALKSEIRRLQYWQTH